VAAAGRVAFGLIDGGVLCNACRAGRQQVAAISAGVLRTMAQFADPDGQAWKRIEIPHRSLGELRGVMGRYLTHLLGKKLRLHQYLGPLWS
jgi:DNA repair protein RecO (recombination protein O)